MKKRVISFLLALVMLLSMVPSAAFATEETIIDSGTCGANGDNLTWTLDAEGTLTISGEGAMADYNVTSKVPWSGYRKEITAISIDERVTSIGQFAFHGCSISNVTIPCGVTAIGLGAFSACKNLTDVIISDSVSSIGSEAFYGCSALTTITFPESVSSLGAEVFYDCDNLKEIIFKGNAPSFDSASFNFITVTAYYPCDNDDTWTSNVMKGYGGTITWMANHDGVAGAVTAPTCTEQGYTTYTCGICGDTYQTDFIPATGHNYVDGVCAGCGKEDVVASGTCGTNLTWKLDSNGLLTISGTGTMSNYRDGGAPWVDFRDSLTGLVLEEGLTSIGNYAFFDCSGFTGELTIPSGVTAIGYGAFYHCSGFTGNLIIPDSVTAIDGQAFRGCSGFTGDLIIPNSVTSIGRSAFNECSGFTGKLSISDSLTAIDINVFYDCSGFTGDLIIPDSVTSIGDGAFRNCSGFTGELIIPDEVTAIGGWAFDGCSGFTGDLIIPYQVTTIDELAFRDCSGFTGDLIIPDRVTTIREGAFDGCSGFTGKLILPYKLTTIEGLAFRNCSGFTGSLTIPDSVTTLGSSAFWGCDGFTGDLIIGDSVTTIGDGAFGYCNNLTDIFFTGNAPVTMGDGIFSAVTATVYYPCNDETWTADVMQDYGGTITWMANHDGVAGAVTAPTCEEPGYTTYTNCKTCGTETYQSDFIPATGHNYVDGVCAVCGSVEIFTSGTCGANGDNLTWTLDVAGTLTISGVGAMENYNYISSTPWYWHRDGMTTLVLEEGITRIGSNAFNGCSELTGDLIIPDSVTTISYAAFQDCSGFTGGLIIGDSVTTIGSYAFDNCSGFTGDLVIPDSVTTIGHCAFEDCSGFTGGLTIPDSVTTIDSYAFQDCSGFTGDLNIPDSVTIINDGSFWGCSGFTGNLTIPNSVTTISYSAFFECSGFTGDLIIPDSVTTIANNAFWNCSGFTGNLTIPDSVTTIDYNAFRDCSGFTGDLIIPNSITTIDAFVFSGCSGFTGNLIIPDSVTTIGNSAFNGCSGFTGDLTIPGSITAINDSVFLGCSGFTGNLIIPDTVTAIGEGAFRNCSGLTGDLIIPDSVTTIGGSAFQDCSGFTGNLTIPDSITSIGGWTFAGCSGFTGDLIIPDSVTTIGGSAFQDCSGFTGNLTISDSITDIGDLAFTGCSGFTGDLIIPNSVTDIGYRLFDGCSGFTGNLTIPDSVTTIGDYAFSGCSGLDNITFSGNAPDIKKCAFDTVFAIAHYPCGNETWTYDKRQGYGGALVWKKNHGDNWVAGTCHVCGETRVFITQQPVSVTVKNGETAKVIVVAEGEGLTYQWYYTSKGGLTEFFASSNTTATYTTTMDSTRAGRQVYCVITDKYGNTVQSNTVTLNMTQDVALKITQQPTSVTVKNGETAKVTVVAEGEGLTYQWYIKNKGDKAFSASSIKIATYSVAMDASRDGRQLCCVITDKYGNSVTTDTVTLSLDNKVAITKQPANVSVGKGVTAEITVVAEGEGLNYQWYIKNKGDKAFSVSSIKIATYSAAMDASRDGRQVYCVVTDKYGNSVQTNTVTMTMLKPKITVQPQSVKVALNKTFTVSFTAQGEGLTYEWYYKDAGSSKFTKTGTFTSNSYTTQMTEARAGRQIYCVVTDKYGSRVTTNTVTLSLDSKVIITRQPQSVTVAKDKTATVSFTATGLGLTYEWYFKNAGQSSFTKTATFTGPEYTTQMNETRAGRQIYCVVTDKYGNSAQTNTVTLGMHPLPKITVQPVAGKVKLGETVTVSFTATGEGLKYEWYYKNAGQSSFTKTTSFTSNSYSVEMSAARAGRQIYCVVTDKYGNSIKTNTVTLNMEKELAITRQPQSVTAAKGKTATVSFTATGEGLKYEWYYKNKGETKFTKTTSFTSNSYSVEMTAARAGRQIYCVVTDKYGNTVKSNTVTLNMG